MIHKGSSSQEYSASSEIIRGHLLALFAFDVGYEVALDKLAALFAAARVQPLSRKRQTPAYLQFAIPPVTLELETRQEYCDAPASLQATVFDFGAVSLAYRYPLPFGDGLSLEHLAQIGAELYGRNLETIAWQDAHSLVERIAPAIHRPRLSDLIEDYYLYVLEAQPKLTAKVLQTDFRRELAQALTFETSQLSDFQIEETLNQSISYLQTDLTIVDWNAAMIFDCDYEDTVRVLELLNVELLEARYIDRMLDQKVKVYAGLLQKPSAWPVPLRTPYRRALQELTEWRLESTVLSERVTNALKLIGDLYLSRVHAAAAAKVHLPEWEKIIAEKIQILDELYDRMDDRVRTAQSQTLEVIIVALIVVELFLALVGHR